MAELVNALYFLAGLAVSFFQIWQNQRYFQAGQQEKFARIANDMTRVREILSGIAQVTSEQASEREERFFALISRSERAVVGEAVKATDAIKEVVQQQLRDAGVTDAVDRTNRVEEELKRIVSESAERVAQASRSLFPPDLTPAQVEATIEALRARGGTFTLTEFAHFLDIAKSAARMLLEPWVISGQLIQMGSPDVYAFPSTGRRTSPSS